VAPAQRTGDAASAARQVLPAGVINLPSLLAPLAPGGRGPHTSSIAPMQPRPPLPRLDDGERRSKSAVEGGLEVRTARDA
jgi:hypothetical protein